MGDSALRAASTAEAARAYSVACAIGDGPSCVALVQQRLVDDAGLRERLIARAKELGSPMPLGSPTPAQQAAPGDAGQASAPEAVQVAPTALSKLTGGEATRALSPRADQFPGQLADPACAASDACQNLQKGCNEGDVSRCSLLASAYAYGILGVAKDLAKGAALGAISCDAEPNGAACGNLALMYLNGNGVPKSKQRALELTTRSCDANFEPACAQLRDLGEAAHANAVLRELCDAGRSLGCVHLCAVAKEKPHAVERLQALCGAGDQVSCAQLSGSCK